LELSIKIKKDAKQPKIKIYLEARQTQKQKEKISVS
jgi:hypothetical protein